MQPSSRKHGIHRKRGTDKPIGGTDIKGENLVRAQQKTTEDQRPGYRCVGFEDIHHDGNDEINQSG